MKVLVTGGTGFVGYHLVSRLLELNHEVTCLVRESSNTEWLDSLKNINYVYGELVDPESLINAVKEQDWIFHLAGVVIALDREGYFRINRDGTANLIQTVLQHNPHLKKFIYVSSQAAGGPSKPGKPRTEDMPANPVTHYGESKLAAEKVLSKFQNELPILIIRPPSVYGPHDIGVLTFFQLINYRLQVYFIGNDLHLSLIYVQDLVNGMLQLATADLPNGEIFYIDDGSPLSLKQIQGVIARVMEKKTLKLPIPRFALYPVAGISELINHIRQTPSFVNYQKIKEITQPAWTCYSQKIQRMTNFKPQITLTEGAKITADWYRQHGWI